MAEKLKNCPFCGSYAELQKDKELDCYSVKCLNCPTDVGRHCFWKKEDAIKAWNRRV